MTRWFVSRHPGAVEWAKQQNLAIDRIVPHLNPAEVQEGDLVYGILPVELAAQVCRRGARFFGLCFTVAEAQRGVVLTADDLTKLNARFREYQVVEVEEKDP